MKKPLDQYGPQSVAKVPAVDSGNDDEDDDDDFDLFGSDDEEAVSQRCACVWWHVYTCVCVSDRSSTRSSVFPSALLLLFVVS